MNFLAYSLSSTKPMTLQEAYTFSQTWIENWNDKHLQDYCLMHDEQAEEISSIANRLLEVSRGRLKGIQNLSAYWEFLRRIYPENKYILQKVTLHHNDILIYFTMSGLKTNAIARLSLTHERKIARVIISHV